MSNTDIKKIIQAESKIDVDAIRNLSKLANDLTNNGKLTVPGGLEVGGKLTVNGVSTFNNLRVNGGAVFGISSGRPLKIVPSNWSNEVTYIGFFRGKRRTGYFMKR